MGTRFDLAGHLYIAATLALTVFGQLVIKWQMGGVGPLPEGATDKLLFLLRQCLNPWVVCGFASAFLASLAWMAVMTRLELNYAYPFMSLAFVIVMLFSIVFLGEAFSLQKVLGTSMVVAGLLVISRS